MVKSVVRSALENHNTVNKNSNEVYFVSKQACAKRVRERERERKGGREGGASMSRIPRIPINEVYSVSKQVCAKRMREREREGERRRGKHDKN